jgi:hypothetical protein
VVAVSSSIPPSHRSRTPTVRDMVRTMSSQSARILVVLTSGAALLGCANAGGEASSVPPGTCVVSSKVGLMNATAYVSGPDSSVRWGLADTTAQLDAGEVRMTKGMLGKPRIGEFEGDLARVHLGLVKEDLAPVVDGRTSVKLGFATYEFQSTDCETAELQLGAIHISGLVLSSKQV